MKGDSIGVAGPANDAGTSDQSGVEQSANAGVPTIEQQLADANSTIEHLNKKLREGANAVRARKYDHALDILSV